MDTLYRDILNACKELELDKIDSMLKNDEFYDEDEIYEFLYNLNMNDWNYVCENKNSYPPRVRQIIDPNLNISTKLRVVELTNEVINRIEKEEEDKKNTQFEIDWEQHQLTANIERPFDEVDDSLDEAWDNLIEAKSRMETYLKRKNASYIPPSQRNNMKISSEQNELEDEIQSLENEYSRVERLVEVADSKYLERKKDEYKVTWLRKMQA